MLTAAGVGSGLDIESMISQLMALERRPLNRLEARKVDVQIDISANGQLRSAISRFHSAVSAVADTEALSGLSADSSNSAVLTVTTGANAQAQNHDIEVLELATRHRLASNAWADADTAVGTGNLDITIGGDTLSLVLDGSNNTLNQISDAINASPDNPGLTASVLTVNGGAQLILTANDTGLANEITVTADASLAAFTTSQVGVLQDASITIDGFAHSSSSNTIEGTMQGVTLNLLSQGTSTINIETDTSLLATAVEEFANAYNFMRGNIKALSENALSGDSMLLGLERSINNRISSTISMPDSETGHLFEAGISFNDVGDLVFDASKLAAAASPDPSRILSLLGPDSSLTSELDTFLNSYLEEDGIIDSRISTLESRDRVLDRQVERTTFRLDQTETRLRAQFTALDTLLARLTVTSDFLTQQLDSLPSSSNNN